MKKKSSPAVTVDPTPGNGRTLVEVGGWNYLIFAGRVYRSRHTIDASGAVPVDEVTGEALRSRPIPKTKNARQAACGVSIDGSVYVGGVNVDGEW